MIEGQLPKNVHIAEQSSQLNGQSMNLVPVKEILPQPGQFRQEVNQQTVEDLTKSILENGLIHLPVVTPVKGGYMLVAGGRRLEAMKTLHLQGKKFHALGVPVPPGMIPCAVWDSLTVKDAMFLELEENIRRENLTWKEECQAVAKLHELLKEKHPEGWALTDTAKEIKEQGGPALSPTNVHDQILLAKHLSDPLVSGADSMRGGMRQLAKSIERDLVRALGESDTLYSSSTTPSGTVQPSEVDLYIGDAITAINGLLPNRYDVIITDPPYGIGASAQHERIAQDHAYNDTWTSIETILTDMMKVLPRVMFQQAHMYMFTSWEHYLDVKAIVETGGWKVWHRPIIWDKSGVNLAEGMYGPAYSYELILYARWGDKPVITPKRDVINIPFVTKKLHAAQKPVDLYVDLLERSVTPGDWILDPFAGCGTVFAAAKRLGVHASGADIDPGSKELIRELLEQEGGE